MASSVIDTPFGRVSLTSQLGEAAEVRDVRVELPNGMRLEGCRLAALHVPLSTSPVELTLHCDVAYGADISPNSGQYLDAWLVERDGLVGNFAMRDPEWLEYSGIGFDRYEENANGVSYWLSAKNTKTVAISFAAAWTNNPQSEQEDVSPWFAVDLALPELAGQTNA